MGFPLVLVAAALPALVLATWGFGRAVSASELSRLDLRLSETVAGVVSTVQTRVASAAATATSTARERGVQVAMRRHDLAALRAAVRRTRDLAIVLPGGHGRAGRLPAGPSLVQRIVVRSGSVELGSVVVATPLAPMLRERSNPSLVLVREGRVVLGAARGARIVTAATATDLDLEGRRLRSLTGHLGAFDVVALLPLEPVAASVRRAEERMGLAALATLAAVSLAFSLFARRRRGRGGNERSADAIALVEGILGAVHDEDAMLGVVLETAVVVSGAAGGELVWRGAVTATGAASATDRDLDLTINDPTGTPLGRLRLTAGRDGFDRAATAMVSAVLERGVAALESVRLHQTVLRQALTDELTELANRRRFSEALRTEVARAERAGTPLSLVLLDIDGFKRINDEFGHQGGDDLLRAIAETISLRVRGTDVAARLGGDEFAVLLADTPLSGAIAFAETLRSTLHDEKNRRRLRFVTASCGVNEWHHGTSGYDFVRETDDALYAAKRSGRDCVVAASDLASGL